MTSQKLTRVMPLHWKLLTSLAICYASFTLGLGVAFLGPTLVELCGKFDSTIPILSQVFTIQNFAFPIGAIACGVIYNYTNRHVTTGLLIFVIGIATIVLPLTPSIVTFFCTATVIGFCWAGYEVAQIVWIVEIWGGEAPPFIQAQDFAFALGAFASPLITEVFLADRVNRELMQGKVFAGFDQSPIDTVIHLYHLPFLIGGLATILGGIFIFLLYCANKFETSVLVNKELEQAINTGKSNAWNFKKTMLVCLSAIFLGGYQGIELCNIQFISTFCRFIALRLSQPESALLLSGLTGAFAVGRAVGIILLVIKVPCQYLLIGNCILILTANTLLFCFANDSHLLLWVGTVMLGFGISNVSGSFYGFIERHIKVSNGVGAIMIVAEGIVASLYPLILGTYIERNPFVLMYTNYFSILICIIAFSTIYVVTQKSSTDRISTPFDSTKNSVKIENRVLENSTFYK